MESSLRRGWLYRQTPNLVTAVRLVATVWLVWLMIEASEQAVLMCILVIWCALSDVLDGLLARKMGVVSRIGGVLDRLADKIFICSLLIFIAWGHASSDDVPHWLRTLTQGIVTVILLFEITLMCGSVRSAHKGKDVQANKHGKAKMVLESSAIIFWVVCLAVDKGGWVSGFWPLFMTDVLLGVSIFFALKSLKGYSKELLGID